MLIERERLPQFERVARRLLAILRLLTTSSPRLLCGPPRAAGPAAPAARRGSEAPAEVGDVIRTSERAHWVQLPNPSEEPPKAP